MITRRGGRSGVAVSHCELPAAVPSVRVAAVRRAQKGVAVVTC